MEKKKNDLVGDDAHGGREDLGPADRPELPHDDDRGPADYASACDLTPSGYNVTSWMEEMTEQHTTMKAVMRELLAELQSCHEAGTTIDFLSPLITRAYDTVEVIRVTEADLKEFGWVAKRTSRETQSPSEEK